MLGSDSIGSMPVGSFGYSVPPYIPKADWRSAKGLGPWDFKKQENKWGYLNNPIWTASPEDPVDYTGRESEEPQIWNMNRKNF